MLVLYWASILYFQMIGYLPAKLCSNETPNSSTKTPIIVYPEHALLLQIQGMLHRLQTVI